MKRCIALQAVLALMVASMAHAQQSPQQANPPRAFLLDGKHLQAARERVRKGDKTFESALAALARDAQAALTHGPYSVVTKERTPPSGDKHDYMSQATYFWPNPQTADGLPYVRRDGESNPETGNFPDHALMSKMESDVSTLALAYYFLGDEKYAAKASELIRAWFLDPAMRMNPNLQFAQAIPGVNTGRGIGIIDSHGLADMLDYVGLLAGSSNWKAADQRGLEQWFSDYLQWLRDSQNGRQESAEKNNHGTYYDVQIAAFALFTGNEKLAGEVLREVGPKRIAVQIEPDGRQPLELARTKSWSYSLMNLDGLMSLARLGEHVDVDLWNYRAADGRSIRKALDYVLTYALGEQKWPHKQITGWSPQPAYALLKWAAIKYPDRSYRTLCSRLPATEAESRDVLLFPQP